MAKKKKKPKKAKVLSFKDKREDIEVNELAETFYARFGPLINEVRDSINTLIAEHDGLCLNFLMNELAAAVVEISKRIGLLPGEDPLNKIRPEDREKFRPKGKE